MSKPNNWMTRDEMIKAGISFGRECKVSRLAQIHTEYLSLGDYVQIDDFCVLMGHINIGNHVHIPLFCALYGKHNIIMGSFSGMAPRCTVYTSCDDYSGLSLISSTIPDDYKPGLTKGPVVFEEHAVIGEGVSILCSVRLGAGSVVGAHSLVKRSTLPWSVYAGNPASFIKTRPSDRVLKLAQQLTEKEQRS